MSTRLHSVTSKKKKVIFRILLHFRDFVDIWLLSAYHTKFGNVATTLQVQNMEFKKYAEMPWRSIHTKFRVNNWSINSKAINR
jgi:hypothetical protein